MAKWQIRPATTGDTKALVRCIDAAYSVYIPHIKDLPAVSEGILGDIENHMVFVADLDNRIVGGLVLVAKTDHALLANVAVDPDKSGMGVARALIEHAEHECRRMQISELRLSTHVDMPENVKLYKHLGWKKTAASGNKVHMAKAIQRSAANLPGKSVNDQG